MPSSLEEALKLSPYVANAMIHGDGRSFNVALIVINDAAVRAWAQEKGFTLGEDPTIDGRVRGLIGAELQRLFAEFRRFEQPREFALLREDFTIQNGLLTPTLKLKRQEVLARYGGLIEELYGRQEGAAAPAGGA